MDHTLPDLASDYKLIKERHGTLVPTGCTEEFCAVGQATLSNERRVGENRAIDVVEQEAEEFLRELYQDKFFASEQAFQERLQTVRHEIRSGSVEGIIRETEGTGVVGGTWTQTSQELEFGIRRAWRNARKCIMRSHCEDLRLCDLRSVNRSKEMAVELVKGLAEAYNGGNIVPTVFVFPPRTANNRGPMIWNDQILSFAGYEAEDGTILGDPKNIQLTKDIIELGWVPPQSKSRWDVLPVVVMAEDDEPAFVELPENIRKLVEIRHPRYDAVFQKLDLKWVAFPALSKLGFDIGGVQYTATPFIGWFMDTEIGIRDLANPLRYNILPDLIAALYLDGKTPQYAKSLKDLATYELLAMLSRAQIELNYAVYHSFLREGITMSDSLTASKKWAEYDDEFEKRNGYRLPSDPYSLAPLQGSIVPVWYRGDALNYQPKPLISWHAQDPVSAWRMEKSKPKPTSPIQLKSAQSPTEPSGALENKSQDGSQAVSDDVGEPGPLVPDIEAHSSDDAPTLKISPSSDEPPCLKPIAESANVEPALPSDKPRPSNGVRSFSLSDGWGPLVDPAAAPEPSPSRSVDNISTSVDPGKTAISVRNPSLVLQRTRGHSFLSRSVATAQKSLPISKYLSEYSQQYDPFSAIKFMWPVVCFPTLLVLILCLEARQ